MLRPMTCRMCGHSWIPRVHKPVECPNCKSRDWKPLSKVPVSAK